MSHLYQRAYSYKKRKKAVLYSIIFSILISIVSMASGCQVKSEENQDNEFREFTKETFIEEVSSNTVSLHYTLRDEQNYGVKNTPITFGSFTEDSQERAKVIQQMEEELKEFSYGSLSTENQLTYDVMQYYLELAKEGNTYAIYEEPLGIVSGVQTQMPVILSEYQFYDEEDIEEYLELIKTTPEYFDSLIAFEKKKAQAGVFMADYAVDSVIEQCQAFMNMGNENYLISTFSDRLDKLDELSLEKKSQYLQENALLLKSYILPSYSKLVQSLQELKGSGNNEQGLCYLPNGKEFYSYLVREATGSRYSVTELEELTRKQIIEDLEAMEAVLGITAKEAKETAVLSTSDPEEILRQLERGIETAFPKLENTQVDVKYVPEAMEEHLSPAFYMIPALDATEENVIYVNEAHMGDALTLYTTLAHEGYPGHLYQTVYYARTNPDPLRSIFNFGGYVEGWATYAEMCSYYLETTLSKEQATLLQKNNSILLALYALADMGIHYDGWSRVDTAAFFKQYGIEDTQSINRIYELIIGSPANYLKYYIGYVEFMQLKKEWIAKKGEQYSQKEFHKAVLDVGPAPFEIVEKYMWKEWK